MNILIPDKERSLQERALTVIISPVPDDPQQLLIAASTSSAEEQQQNQLEQRAQHAEIWRQRLWRSLRAAFPIQVRVLFAVVNKFFLIFCCVLVVVFVYQLYSIFHTISVF